ncbi:hypothetical protein [Roseateles sp.]
MATQKDIEWAKEAWRETLRRCLRSLAAQLETDARHLRAAELKAKPK